MSDNNLVVYDQQAIDRWQELAGRIRAAASTRRRDKTPPSKVKQREGANGKMLSYVDRPDYQIWLDNKFPGWTTENERFWTEHSTHEGQENPILFCASFVLVVIDEGIKRRIPCVGSMHVSTKELTRESSSLLANKYTTAVTNAYKLGCNWLGAFFDLRADDEEREKAAQPATKEQLDRFTALLVKVPVEHKNNVTSKWNKMNASNADVFLNGLEDRLSKLEQDTAQESVAHEVNN